MNVLHVIPSYHSGNMVRNVINFYDRHFAGGHSFCLYSRYENPPNQFAPDVAIPQQIFTTRRRNLFDCLKFILYIRKYDLIVLHFMLLSQRTQLLILLFFRPILKKTVWIEWGSDLFEYEKLFGGSRKSCAVYRWFCRSISFFVAIFPPDAKVFREKFGNRAKIYSAPYAVCVKEINAASEVPADTSPRPDVDGAVRILVCHRCYSLADPIGAIRAVAKFANENVRVVIPCGGGESEYVARTLEYARSVFGDKVEAIDHYLTHTELLALSNSVDIVVFNAHRQIALGTLGYLFTNRKKVFLASEGVMFDYFRSQGIPIGAVKEIANMTFEEFVRKVDMEPAVQYWNDVSDMDKLAVKWDAIYKDIEHELQLK